MNGKTSMYTSSAPLATLLYARCSHRGRMIPVGLSGLVLVLRHSAWLFRSFRSNLSASGLPPLSNICRATYQRSFLTNEEHAAISHLIKQQGRQVDGCHLHHRPHGSPWTCVIKSSTKPNFLTLYMVSGFIIIVIILLTGGGVKRLFCTRHFPPISLTVAFLA